MSKLNLDRDLISSLKTASSSLVEPIQRYIHYHSSVAVERATLRFLGVEGEEREESLPTLVLDKIEKRKFPLGIAHWFCQAGAQFPELSPENLAQRIVAGEINLNETPEAPSEKILKVAQGYKAQTDKKIQILSKERQQLQSSYRKRSEGPLKIFKVGTGNLEEELELARFLYEQGGDQVSFLRSSGQSLLDTLPSGKAIEGLGGSFATPLNFRKIRKSIVELSHHWKRPLAFTHSAQGLCMPEIAAMAALEGFDGLVSDPFEGILLRNLNMKRMMVDQYAARRWIHQYAMRMETPLLEDGQALTPKHASQFLTLLLLSVELAHAAGVSQHQMSLAHPFHLDCESRESFLLTLSLAQIVKELFFHIPVQFVFPASNEGKLPSAVEPLFHLASLLTHQSALCFELSSKRSPWLEIQDSMREVEEFLHAMGQIHQELEFQSNGKIARFARQILEETLRLLRKIEQIGLMSALEQGLFLGISRSKEEGKGLEGVFQKDRNYFNPCLTK